MRVHHLVSALPLALHIASEMAGSRQLILPGCLLLVGLHHLLRVLLAADCWLMIRAAKCSLLRGAGLRPVSLLVVNVHMLLGMHGVPRVVARAR